MTDLTISIPDELMERLRPHLKEMTRVLELGVERIEQIAPTPRDQLAKQYEELALMWEELREDIADEKWLPVENEALLRFESSLKD